MGAYRTVEREAEDAFVEKRSRFIGYAKPVETEEEALAFLAEKRQKHWDASHNVYAYSIRGGAVRFSDDGEPQGTAGMPVLDVIQKSGVTNVAVVVTRYFGGILLGGGGLVRAYSHGASIALAAAGIVEMRECLRLRAVCDYGRYGRLQSLIPECGGVVEDTAFAENVELRFHMEPEKLPAFEKRLADATNGAVSAETLGSAFFAFPVEEA